MREPPADPEPMIRIGELARRSGVSVRALRYYESQGLLTAQRSEAGQRHYPASAADKVGFFQDMYAAGLTSRHIAMLLPCIDSGHTDAEQRAMLHDQRSQIANRIEQLRAALRRLDEVIGVTATHP